MHPVTVSNWLTRFEKEGLAGLQIKSGRGRKPILDLQKDAEAVRQSVEEERQRLKQAKLLIEENLDKKFSLKTLKRFLKELTAATNA